MAEKAPAQTFTRTVRQKADAAGNPLPIWQWVLKRDNIVVALGERRSERQAVLAAQLAEQHYGCDLGAGW